MGVKIVLAEREPIGLALKRFRKALERHPHSWKPHKAWLWRNNPVFVPQTQIRRAKRFRRKFKARLGLFKEMLAGKREAGRSWPPV
jgi:hypothetical protein